MSKLVILSLAQGNLQCGFPAVTAQLWADARDGIPDRGQNWRKRFAQKDRQNQVVRTPDSPGTPMKFQGSLPPASELEDLYQRWQLLYDALSQRWLRRIIFDESSQDVLQVSSVDFDHICAELQNQLNNWLNSSPFRRIDQQLRRHLSPTDQIRVIIETDDEKLRRLPWHLWDFFEDYPKAEIALSTVESVALNCHTPPGQVRILAILGNSTGVDLAADRQLLEALPDVELVFLEEPGRRELDEHLWDKRGWDILFFAGHSQTEGETGLLHINQTDTITVPQLKNALRQAIARGLQLAIFNSCDGLGLARQLEDLNIPQIIVMREPVADGVAQEFLKHFLAAFAGRGFRQSTPLHLAVQEAREKLQPLEDDFPCASWMPVLCQNPALPPPTWQDLRGVDQQRLQVAQVASVAVTVLVLGLRALGVLQMWELRAFDQLMRSRPDESPDPRLLIVEATLEDVNQYGYPLPDEALAQLVQKLDTYQPRVISLAFFRDQAEGELLRQLQTNDRLVGMCSSKEPDDPNQAGIKPPPEVPPSRIGFSEVIVDPDQTLRRHLMFMIPYPDDPCPIDSGFSIQVAQQYLAGEGIVLKQDSESEFYLGSTRFQDLSVNSGPYLPKNMGGFQMVLNYRKTVAQTVQMSEILQDEVNPNLIKDRVVLIGITDPTTAASTHFSTPYSAEERPYKESAGIEIHAQMVSQILSAVLDGRPFISMWSAWGDGFWIWGWSVVGGILGWRFRNTQVWGIATGVAIVLLSGACLALLIIGFWVPLIPSLLAIVMTGGIIIIWTANS